MNKNLKPRSRQTGVTLVELLVSMLIAGIIFAGVVSVVQVSQSSFVSEQENSFIQENARFALETIARDVRMAGNYGCARNGTAGFVNAVNGDLGGLLALDAIIGFEGSGGIDTSEWPDAYESEASPGSDSVLLRYADPETNIYIQDHTGYASGQFNLHSAHSWRAGEKLIVVESNCRQAGVFEITNGVGTTIEHNAVSGSPGNCTIALYNNIDMTNPIDCSSPSCGASSCGGQAAVAFSDGAGIQRFVANGYFIGESNVVPGMPALKRQVLTASGSRSEELAQGVENMEILFGLSTADPTSDVNVYLSADEVTDWAEVIAIRVTLIVRSLSEVHTANQTTTLNGTTYNDRFVRQMIASTIKLRNRGGG